jgi:2,3-bisphosphoglycerate-independent phosphoglycerate mutase
MDRDRRWDRIQRAYNLLMFGRGDHRAASGADAARDAYARGETDEFITPVVVGDSSAVIRPGDSVFAFNFRPDRMREITLALADPGFGEIDRGGEPVVERYATMTQYEEDWDYPVAFAPEHPSVTLPHVLADRGVRQLHVAETEKYAHVTYFFNGGVEKPYPGEDRVLVPSPKVATYDLKPEMSAAGVADAVVHAIEKGDFDAIIMNFANADMVGHSGKLEPTIKACEVVDESLGRIFRALRPRGGAWIITADHGNAETMIDPATGGPHTYHTTNPVPLILVSEDANTPLQPGGSLRDIAPTLLGVLGLDEPHEMTGRDLRATAR